MLVPDGVLQQCQRVAGKSRRPDIAEDIEVITADNKIDSHSEKMDMRPSSVGDIKVLMTRGASQCPLTILLAIIRCWKRALAESVTGKNALREKYGLAIRPKIESPSSTLNFGARPFRAYEPSAYDSVPITNRACRLFFWCEFLSSIFIVNS